MFVPWPTRLTGAPPPFTATSSCCQPSQPPPTTARTTRSSLTTPPPLWALTGVAAPPSGSAVAKTTQMQQRQPEAPEQQQLLPAGAQPDPAGQAGWTMPQPLHPGQQDLQLRRQLLLVGKLSSPGGVNAWSSSRTTPQALSSWLTQALQCPWFLVQHLHRAACSPPPMGRPLPLVPRGLSSFA